MFDNRTRILYVEDDLTSRMVMQMLLDHVIGMPYTIFENSADFINKLSRLPQKPGLFLLDIHIQPIDGFQMLDLLRNHPDYKNAVVVAVTASVMNEEVIKLQRAGFDGGIAKPIDQQEFPGLIRQLLNGERVWYIT